MATSSKSTPVMGSDPLEQKGKSLKNPVAILWDIENCHVPRDVRPEDIAGNIIKALKQLPVINGPVVELSAYGNVYALPQPLQEGCQRTGVKLIQVPSGRKNAADIAILNGMISLALDNPPPFSIMLISGNVVDFALTLNNLRLRGYTVILAIPAGVGVSRALCNAGNFVCDWPSMARGKGFVSRK